MSSFVQVPRDDTVIAALPFDERRGVDAMWCVIASELSLFLCLFASYFYLGDNQNRWVQNHPPKLTVALTMLAVLLASSFVLEWGNHQVKRGRHAAGRLTLIATVFIGLVFLTLQTFEYIDHWRTLTPYSNAYGSIFYAITSFHAAHVIVGLLILAYVGFLPAYGPSRESPYRPYKTASMYWHFVDVVWILIVVILYIIPNVIVHG